MTIKWKDVMSPCREVDGIICDMCGGTCWLTPNWEYSRLNAEWGYGSSRDTECWNYHYCDKCSDKIMMFIKSDINGYC